MKPERWRQVDQIFQAALEHVPDERAAYIDSACGSDNALRREVEALLAADEQAKNFIEVPAYAKVAPMLVEAGSRLLVGQSINHYQISSLLGIGGMGEVYQARDTRLDRTVALKVLPAEIATDNERMRRFVSEAKAASALNHPHVATIYEIGEAEGIRFIAMEYVEGQTLAAKINGQPLAINEIVEIGCQIADALDEAHEKGVTHRDIKPANVMLTPRGQVKVLDFGLAKISRLSAPSGGSEIKAVTKTAPGVVMGTVPYMSPEQALGREVDYRSDLFSLGVVLYEMATGRLPFAGSTTSELLDRILHAQPEAIGRFNYDFPAELERIVLKCLEKDRERRYQSARELLVDLKNQERDSQISAKTVTPVVTPNRYRRWLLIALSGILLALGLGAFYLLFSRAQPKGQAIKSLAVLPLENLSADPAQEYFADGMTEALISGLAQLHALNKVISRTSVMRYKGSPKSLPEIAGELKVDAVIEGTVQRVGERVRVTAKLIPAATDSPVWTRVYERDLSDVLKLQSDIAREVAEEIRIQVTAEERARLASARTIDPAAHKEYWLGRYHYWKFNEEGLSRAIEHFERAIELAPDYAAAYSGLAAAWRDRGIFGSKTFKEVETKARAATEKALALDNNLAEAHASLGRLKFNYDFDWSGAEESMKRALALDPNNLDAHHDYAFLLLALGRFDEAIDKIERAAQLDPLSSVMRASFGRVLYRARKYEEAVGRLNQALDLDPRNSMAYGRLGDVYTEMERYEEASAAFIKAQSFSNNPMYKARLARAYVRAGKRREALRLLEELKITTRTGRFPGVDLAAVYTALGDKDEAFRLLLKMVDERDQVISFIKFDPPFDSLHSDPRWKPLLRRINFPEE